MTRLSVSDARPQFCSFCPGRISLIAASSQDLKPTWPEIQVSEPAGEEKPEEVVGHTAYVSVMCSG